MIKSLALGTLAMGLALAVTTTAAPLTLNFSSNPTSTISFDGSGHFGFITSSGSSFTVGSSNGTNSAFGALGNITPSANNTFKIGTITTVGGTETAAVTDTVAGSAETLVITDSSGDTLTGALDFSSITSTSSGAGGQVNYLLAVNLTNLVYSGAHADADLQTLAADQKGILTVTYAFSGGTMDLNALASTITNDEYSGQITATPEPLLSGLALLGVNGLCVALWRRRQANNKTVV